MAVIFDYIWPNDILYMKIAGNKEPVSIPLIEAFAGTKNISYDRVKSMKLTEEKSEPHFCLTGDNEKGPNQIFDLTADDLITKLQKGIYNDKYKISSIAIQPKDLLMQPEVKQFLEL